ncbi:MAG: hypothetical protein RRB13_08985 [bacterium]|nr:hypothetical protein [bacterium]
MDWLWLFALLPVCLFWALWLPLRLSFSWEPFSFEVHWGLLGFALDKPEQQARKRLWLGLFWWSWGTGEPKKKKQLAKTQKPKQDKKALNKPKKKRNRPHIGWAEAKMLLKHPVPRIVLGRLKQLGLGLWAALRLDRLQLTYGGMDAYSQGLLAGVAASLPLGPRFRLISSFTGDHNIRLEGRIFTWRLVLALFLFLARLPYLKAYRLYRQLNQPHPQASR